MKGMLENQPLFLSLFGALGMVWVCASGLFPQFNDLLKLEPIPEDLQIPLMTALCVSFFGCFMWDRFCHFLFAREIFDVMVWNVTHTTFVDLIPLFKTLGYAAGGIFLLGTGNTSKR